MWNVNPKIMCRKHLLGEHVEMHMFLGSIIHGRSLDGFLQKGLVEVHNIKQRHDQLVSEMIDRGYNHKSPLIIPKKHIKPMSIEHGHVDKEVSLNELLSRCRECRKRSENI